MLPIGKVRSSRLHGRDKRLVLTIRKVMILVMLVTICMSISFCIKIALQASQQERDVIIGKHRDDIQLIEAVHGNGPEHSVQERESWVPSDIPTEHSVQERESWVPSDIPTEHSVQETESWVPSDIPTEHSVQEKESWVPSDIPIVSDFSSLNEFECVAWRATSDCIPSGNREADKDGDCYKHINRGSSGYCEIRHQRSGTVYQVLPTHCDTVKHDTHFTCSQFALLLTYGSDAMKYVHDKQFTSQLEYKWTHVTEPSESRGRGIVMVIHDRVLPSAYASVRLLRSHGSSLPIEMWFKSSEVKQNHPILYELAHKNNVTLREINDPRATQYMTKLHAVYYSAFDQLLFLDADNFCVRDPTYLFYHPTFLDTGAVFWPDYWTGKTSLYNLHANSLAWTVFQLPFVDMMEQESGQLLIDRRKHMRALNVLMYYGFAEPRVWEDFRLVWGDKDLFRFAWMRTNSSFHMITRPPGTAGRKHHEFDYFCGVTMVQYDLNHEILFMHRNAVKFSAELITTEWLYIQQFKYASYDVNDYVINDRYVRGSDTFGNYTSCFGRFEDYHKFTVDPIEAFPFAQMEITLQSYVQIGVTLGKN